MTEKEMDEAVEDTLNGLFGGVLDRDDVPFDELYITLTRKEPRAALAGGQALEDSLARLEAANKIITRDGVIHLI